MAFSAIEDIPVRTDNLAHIGYLFHTAFYFKGCHTGLYELIHKRTIVQVLRTQHIVFIRWQHIFATFINEFVRQSTWLRTGTTITATATNKGAHQTLPRIAYAKGPMNKDFNFNLAVFTDMADFIKTQFTA